MRGGPGRPSVDLLLAEHYGVDEIMGVTVTHSFEARMRTDELRAEMMGPEGQG